MIKVFIVEDHPLVIEGLAKMFEAETAFELVGFANTAADCMEFFNHHNADVIVMDINLPDMSGVDLCKIIKTKYAQINILALSTYNEGIYITKIIENGASGYLLKNVTKAELFEAIKTVANGLQYFSFETEKIYRIAIEQKKIAPILTKREIEILKLIANGLTNLQISKQLFISIDTVDTHRKNIYSKIEVNNTAQVIRWAIDNGFLTS